MYNFCLFKINELHNFVNLFYLFGVSLSLCFNYNAAACYERSNALNSKH